MKIQVSPEPVFSGTDEEYQVWLEAKYCRQKPSPHSTARCEMDKGHKTVGTTGTNFHAGRTRGGYWKFWDAE